MVNSQVNHLVKLVQRTLRPADHSVQDQHRAYSYNMNLNNAPY